MGTRIFAAATLALSVLAAPALGEDDHKAQHGGQVFHSFRLEIDSGAGRDGSVSTLDLNGWIGTDEDKLWIKGEFEKTGSDLEQSELWVMYSRNVSDFWDVQAGIRFDFDPTSTGYVVVGIEGLAPYFVETEAHIFVSQDGDVSARVRREHDLLLTQRLILQPYGEINLQAQDVPELEVGAGISGLELGVKTRYEIHRDFAPYIDVRYENKPGRTGDFAEEKGDSRSGVTGLVGLRINF